MIATVNGQNTQPATKVQGLSLPNVMLRLEGLTVLIAAIVIYAHQGGSLWMFLALLLAPDLSALGYLVNVRVGSITYNLVHFYTLPALLAAASFAFTMPILLLVALIWFAHIGMDRVAGYGLKYPTEFKDTHMQYI